MTWTIGAVASTWSTSTPPSQLGRGANSGGSFAIASMRCDTGVRVFELVPQPATSTLWMRMLDPFYPTDQLLRGHLSLK
eukprot:9789443-Karenia_brevis.AAC.1